jgi:hypothetical protein
MNRFVSRLVRTGAACALLLVAACGDEAVPTAAISPDASADAMLSESGALGALDRLAEFHTPRGVGARVAHRTIGPAGGRFELEGFVVDVPAGAVSVETQFSIRLPANPTGSTRVVAVFGPHGTTFDVPVTLEMPLEGTSIAGSDLAAIVWWNGDDWITIGGEATDDGERIRATTDHFSTYGTSEEGRGGGTLVSGG